MDEYYRLTKKLCDENLFINVEHIDINSSSGTFGDLEDSSNNQKSTIRFTFSLKDNFSVWTLKPELIGAQPQYSRTVDNPLQQDHILIDLEDFRSGGDEAREDARLIINIQLIRVWPLVHDKLRQQWIDMALDAARGVVKFMPDTHDNVSINFNVTIASKLVLGTEERASLEKMWTEIDNFRSANPDPCSICLNRFNGPPERVSTPCGHIFHGDCLNRWLRINKLCPICRANLPE